MARERIYLAGVKARPIKSTREFVKGNIENNYPQYIAVEGKRVVGWCDIITMKGNPLLGYIPDQSPSTIVVINIGVVKAEFFAAGDTII